MSEMPKEERMKLALEAFDNGLFKSKTACAKAFDVPPRTLLHRLNGMTSRKDMTANSRKLSDLEEETLKKWILDMAERGLPLQISKVRYLAQLLLSARLKSSQDASISERWVNRFVQRHNDLQSKYTSRYDYQRAKCEDPQIIKRWFELVHNTIQKYGILEEDIYNMDETGFQMGIISTAKVICGSETRNSHAKSIQPGNREWATAVIAVNASGWVLPPQIILAGQKHQSQWYKALPNGKGYQISVSENGWTNDKLGLEWLQDIFEKHTALQTKGQYRLLILDGHGSHATPGFDQFCTSRKIIPLYMPPHSSHLLQPLDVSCFRPLKHFYGQRVQEISHNGIKTIDKTEFLSIYSSIHQRAFSKSNISSGFKATGLIPLDAKSVMSKLHITKTPTPPSSSGSNQSFHLGRTPSNLYQLNQQRKQLEELQNQALSSVVAEQTLGKVIKGAEIAMHNAILLQDELHQLRTENQRQKNKKKASRYFIQDGGSLTVEEAIQKEKEKEDALLTASSSRPRRPNTVQ